MKFLFPAGLASIWWSARDSATAAEALLPLSPPREGRSPKRRYLLDSDVSAVEGLASLLLPEGLLSLLRDEALASCEHTAQATDYVKHCRCKKRHTDTIQPNKKPGCRVGPMYRCTEVVATTTQH